MKTGTCPVCGQPDIVLIVYDRLSEHNVPGSWRDVPLSEVTNPLVRTIAKSTGGVVRQPTKCAGGGMLAMKKEGVS